MNKSISDALLIEFSRGFAFDEKVRQQINYEQMLALADMFVGWALDKRMTPEQSAWLTGISEGLLAEADLLGQDWNPPEPEELTTIGFMARVANGDRIRPEQTPRGRRECADGNSGDAIEGPFRLVGIMAISGVSEDTAFK